MNKVITGLVCAAYLVAPACTTVEIATKQTSAHITENAQKARDAVQLSAKTLLYVFSREKWSAAHDTGIRQSAANILLRGLKKDTAPDDNVTAYIQRVASTQDVTSDIVKAQQHVDTITLQAQVLLAENPDLKNVKSELDALEKALISSRQAELTFSQAIKAKAYGADNDSAPYLEAYKSSVDGLRVATDAFGGVMRGDLDLSTTG